MEKGVFQKNKLRIFGWLTAFAGLLSCGLWLADALVEYVTNNPGHRSFGYWLLPTDSPHEIAMRLLLVALLFAAGIVVSVVLVQFALVRERVIQLNRALSETRDVALRESEEKYRQLTDNMLDLVALHKPDGTYTYLSPSVSRLLGYTADELIGTDPYDLFHPDDHEKISTQGHQPSLDGRSDTSVEYRIRTKEGDYIWFNTFTTPIYNAQHEVRGLQTVSRDITSRKQAEIALKETTAILRAAMDCSTAGIAIADAPDGKLRYVNDAGLGIRGRSKEEVVDGVDIAKYVESWQILHFDGTPYKADEVPLARAILYGETCDRQFIIRRPDCDDRIVWASAAPITDDEGKVIAGVVVFPDITDIRRAEQEKKQLEEQIHIAQKVESIGRLAGGVAHDLNNMLSPILGYGEMLLDDLAHDDVRRESVNEILSAGLRARDLVRQLLAFSRKQALSVKPLDINKTISNFEKLLRRTVREDIELVFEPGSAVLPVMADVGQVEQVIMNLLVNGADAMPDGGRITIRTQNAPLNGKLHKIGEGGANGPFVLLEISDTGCGMTPEIRHLIFEPFFSTKGERGTGLGLATVYGIVKQHGGDISVESAPGKGTTFQVYLPAAEPLQAADRAVCHSIPEHKGSETILLVEDNDQVRRLTQQILERQGYRVLAAKAGTEALSAINLNSAAVHLLLTDVIMPGMNGKELYAAAAENHPEIKVLYMSGYTDDVIAHHGVLDEGIQFIQKPFSRNGLAAKVREVLEER